MMKVELKTKEDIQIMRLGGKIASRILKILKSKTKEGVTTEYLDKLAEDLILKSDAKPSFKGFGNYPCSICASINNEVVHGIPKNRILKKGDLVSIDIGVFYKGFHTDTALTTSIGKITSQDKKLIKVTEKSLYEGIKKCKAGNYLGDVQNAIQKTIEDGGFGIVRDLAGHGVGKKLQEPPSILNFAKAGTGLELEEGMTLAIEPMVTAGDWRVKVLEDGWTVVTIDGSHAAHFEHTVAITKNGAKILTR